MSQGPRKEPQGSARIWPNHARAQQGRPVLWLHFLFVSFFLGRFQCVVAKVTCTYGTCLSTSMQSGLSAASATGRRDPTGAMDRVA